MGKTELITRDRRERPATKTIRKTANLSSRLVAALEHRAEDEALPLGRVIRQAITQYVQAARTGNLPAIDLDGIEDKDRRGSRGPAAQWPVQVSYVLDADISEEVDVLAKREKVGYSDVVRRALGLAAVRQIVPARAPTRLRHGFVTYDDATRATPSKRPVVQVLDELREL